MGQDLGRALPSILVHLGWCTKSIIDYVLITNKLTYSSEGWKSTIKKLEDSVSGKISLPKQLSSLRNLTWQGGKGSLSGVSLSVH